MSELLKQTALLDSLTDKQREVLLLVAEGMTSKEIARKLSISESAVNQRIEVIRQRLGGMSRASIARLYRDTNALIFTIPTSNSLTGNAIHLQAESEFDQQLSSEGAEVFNAPGDEADGELQPSTFPLLMRGSEGKQWRHAAVVLIAVGVVSLALLLIVVSHSLLDMLGQGHGS
ncbi:MULTISPECIES: LuxR C-terminal-related transcriptional regulator [unclassified Novosphingobium]|uniref:helix-turn-helix domain-containing protein n=1 Tax=unclassified Novosphingobium TaxID=2644732 RepID=UPI0025F588A5|nr:MULTISPECIES: LuxR C-terminal-related transcriptional regulator [unclassified Novosphingobium]HQV02612.1 LuxR C-terminal-related transcriptional regulator [Novosphingobium sp.]